MSLHGFIDLLFRNRLYGNEKMDIFFQKNLKKIEKPENSGFLFREYLTKSQFICPFAFANISCVKLPFSSTTMRSPSFSSPTKMTRSENVLAPLP